MRDSVILIHGLIQGGTTSFDGQYVVEYDPGRDGVDPGSGMPMMCHLVTTPDISKATVFPGTAAFELWRKPDPRNPVRPDGKPNRPLTAFTVEIVPDPGGYGV
jgi:hypothetical protein